MWYSGVAECCGYGVIGGSPVTLQFAVASGVALITAAIVAIMTATDPIFI